MEEMTTVGIDLAKDVFARRPSFFGQGQVVGIIRKGIIQLHKEQLHSHKPIRRETYQYSHLRVRQIKLRT